MRIPASSSQQSFALPFFDCSVSGQRLPYIFLCRERDIPKRGIRRANSPGVSIALRGDLSPLALRDRSVQTKCGGQLVDHAGFAEADVEPAPFILAREIGIMTRSGKPILKQTCITTIESR